MKKISLVSVYTFFLLMSMGVSVAFAQPATGGGNPSTGGGNPTTGGGNSVNVPISIPNPFNFEGNLFDLIRVIIDGIVMPIGGVLCVLAFIYSGFKYVMARGNSKEIEEANRALLYSAVGTAVLLGSWTIARVIEGTINQLK